VKSNIQPKPKQNSKARPKSKQIKTYVLLLICSALIYILIALLPFIGRVHVSDETRSAFSVDNFHGQYEIPERVMLLETPRDAFFHRVNLISKAQEQIILASYAINIGATSDIIVGGLLSAAERGVQVTIIHNAIGGAMPSSYINVLAAHDNIGVYRFNQFNLFRPRFINPALHDKYMIIDNTHMILGGRNIGDRYYNPDCFTGRVAFDREVLIYNTDSQFLGSISDVTAYAQKKLSSQMALAYNRTQRSNWEANTNHFKDLYQEHMAELYLEHSVALQDFDQNLFDYYANTTAVNKITLVTNPIESVRHDSVVAYNLVQLTRNSHTIVAQSPYVVLTNRNLAIFSEMVDGRDFTLSTNSLASTNNLPSFSSYLRRRACLVGTGITIYEFQNTQISLHSKTYLFDGRLTAIGSFNMNERSARLDTESMLIIDSEEFHAITLEAVNAQIAQSLRVNENNMYRSRNHDVYNSSFYSVYEPSLHVEVAHVSRGKKLLYGAAGYLLRMFWFMF